MRTPVRQIAAAIWTVERSDDGRRASATKVARVNPSLSAKSESYVVIAFRSIRRDPKLYVFCKRRGIEDTVIVKPLLTRGDLFRLNRGSTRLASAIATMG